MQNQSFFSEYRVHYDPFHFLEDSHALPYHIARNEPSGDRIEELHYHDGLEIGVCTEGTGVFIIDGESLPFKAPCATLIYPRQLHKARSVAGVSNWYFSTFCPELLLSDLGARTTGELFSPDSYPGLSLFHKESSDGTLNPLYALAQAIITEMLDQPPLFLECIKGYLQALVIRHNRLLPPKQPGSPRELKQLGPIINYISEHFREELTVPGIAEDFGISEATLRRWFADALKISPTEYLHKVRLSAACSMLGAGVSVLEAAFAAGYGSQSSFNRQFRRTYGCSPMEYMRKEKEN